MILYGISGDEWEIEDHPFAKGGEGELHCVKGNDDLIIKLYKKGVLSNKGEKINYMATLYSEDRLKQLAWPIDAVKDQSGQTRGFVMKKFSTTEDMADLLDESSNKSMNLDWKKRIIVALNLSLLVNEIHSMGQIIGDMNPKNFGVDMNNGYVYAFDTDSFHLYDQNAQKWYPCTVLDSHYIAPELQERFQKGERVDSFRPEDTFTTETDRFALAILIFQLLFNGTHPFTAARVPSRGSSVIVHSRVTNIYQRMSPYFNPVVNVTLPVYAPPLSIIPDKMKDAFRQAFLEEKRPQADEWVEMLKELLGQLTKCPKNHYYWQFNGKCPWCKEDPPIVVQNQRRFSTAKLSQSSSRYTSLTWAMAILPLMVLIVMFCIDDYCFGHQYQGRSFYISGYFDRDQLVRFDYYLLPISVVSISLFLTSFQTIALAIVQLRVRYIDRKNSVIRINAFTRLAGLFSILASIGGCLGAILWLFLRPPVYYPAELCVGFGLHSAGCALTLVAGMLALFIRKNKK